MRAGASGSRYQTDRRQTETWLLPSRARTRDGTRLPYHTYIFGVVRIRGEKASLPLLCLFCTRSSVPPDIDFEL